MREFTIAGILLVGSLLLAAGPARAGDDPPAEVKQVFQGLRGLWRSGNTEGLAPYFGKRVTLALDDQTNHEYSKEQAKEALRGYFERTEIVNVAEPKKYLGSGDRWTASFKYEYRGPGDREARERKLTLAIYRKGSEWILESARVMD